MLKSFTTKIRIMTAFMVSLVLCMMLVPYGAYIGNTNDMALASGPVTFDLAYGNVEIGLYDSESQTYVYRGYDSLGAEVTGEHSDSNTYFVMQSDNDTSTDNRIFLIGNSSVPKFDVTISDVYCYTAASRVLGGIVANAVASTPMEVILRLQGNNTIGRVHYGTGQSTATSVSSLKITSAAGDGSTDGTLIAYSDSPWSAAIGGTDETIQEAARNITIAGGTINASVVQSATNPRIGTAAIGGGGNGTSDITITGGNVTATNSGTGATIGGGGGNSTYGGVGNVTITGGTVSATNNYANGVAIGAGGSQESMGNRSTVTITGGTVTTSGNIGGGSSYNSVGGSATVEISGGIVNVTNGGICGGSSTESDGGAVTVSITGGTVSADTISGGIGVGGEATGSVAISGGSVDVAVLGDNTSAFGDDATTPVEKRTINVPNVDQITLVTNVYIVTAQGYPYDYGSDMYTDESGNLELWLPVGSIIYTITTSVGGVETSNTVAPNTPTYTVIVPDNITVTGPVGSFVITAQMHDFLPTEGLSITITAGVDGYVLVLDGHSEVTLEYTLYSDSARTIEIASGGIAAAFSGAGEHNKIIYYSVVAPQYSGTYSDTLTFTVSVS